MEQNFRLYKDPETGKIWQQVGGQDPIEIDEFFAKIMNLDIDSIPVLGKKSDNKMVICPNCGSNVIKAAFCSVCGTKLAD